MINWFFFTINLYNFILFILNNCFKKIFLNYHRRILRRTQAVGISQRVEKYLLHMPLSPTSTSTVLVRQYFIESCKIFTAYATITDDIIPSVIYRCKYRRNYSVGIFPEGIFFGSLFSSTQPSMFFFFTDRKWNYQRSICRWTLSVREVVRKIFTNGVWVLRRWKNSVGKTIKCCSGRNKRINLLVSQSFSIYIYKAI